MKVTEIKIQKKNKNRVSVFLDGEYSFSLDAISAAGLKTGMELDDGMLAKLQDDDLPKKAYSDGLYYLSFKSRTYRETSKHLEEKGYDSTIVDLTLQKFIDINFINDENYAQQFMESRVRLNPKGSFAIKQELGRKGISDEDIEKALIGYDEYEAALTIVRKKLYKWENLPVDKMKNKIYSFLSTRGFSYEITKDIIEVVLTD